MSATVPSDTAVFSAAAVKLPNNVALPVLVTSPVKFAFVVTFPAVSDAAVPSQFVRVPDAGVYDTSTVSQGLAVVAPNARLMLAGDGVGTFGSGISFAQYNEASSNLLEHKWGLVR